ncbi:MAG: hypothetical protein ABEJ36_05165 [Candidatus Nanosalina sp.]
MAFERDYIRYSVTLTLSLVSMISLRFLELSDPRTFLVLLTVPLLLGFTAYISRDGFQRASFLAAATLPFATLGGVFLLFAAVLLLLNVLVSFFASGKSFRSFYGVTSLPLLGTGVVVALGFSAMFLTQPGFSAQVENTTADLVGEQAETFVERSGIIGMQRETRGKMVGSISEASVGLTQVYVLNKTRGNLTPEGQRAVMNAFSSAREEVPQRLESRANRSLGLESVDFSEKSEELVKNIFVKEMFLLFIPLIAFGIYGLQPVVGILTAVAGVFFRELDSYLPETER